MTDDAGPGILLVGAGRMGGALLRGWLGRGVAPSRITVSEPNPSAGVSALLADHGISHDLPGGRQPAAIVLAVKPQIMDDILDGIAPLAAPDTLILSVAAGRTVASIERHFTRPIPVVRSMPNLPAEIGRGITAAYANAHVGEHRKALCESLLGAVGEVAWIEDEDLIDAITAVSGSGPAYVFHLTECLAEAAEAQGISPDLAMRLARATVTGSAELMRQSDLSAAQLRENVTSPKGTTAAALSVLMAEPGLRDLMRRAVKAAAERSRELSK